MSFKRNGKWRFRSDADGRLILQVGLTNTRFGFPEWRDATVKDLDLVQELQVPTIKEGGDA